MAPLLLLELPTAMPSSELVSKWLSHFSLGLTNVMGQLKGKRDLSSRLGAMPVMSSTLLAELSIF